MTFAELKENTGKPVNVRYEDGDFENGILSRVDEKSKLCYVSFPENRETYFCSKNINLGHVSA